MFTHPPTFKYSLVSVILGIIHMIIMCVYKGDSSICFVHHFFITISHIFGITFLFQSSRYLVRRNHGKTYSLNEYLYIIIPVVYTIIIIFLYYFYNDNITTTFNIQYDDIYVGECYHCKYYIPFYIINTIFVYIYLFIYLFSLWN